MLTSSAAQNSGFRNKNFQLPAFAPAAESKREIVFLAAMTLLHLPLGVLLYNSSALAALHPIVVFLIGFRFAWRSTEKLEKTAFICAYLAGVEVLWRMVQAPVFWEFGKYAISLLMLLALTRRRLLVVNSLPVLFIVCLLPSCILALLINDFATARGNISANMSGPFALFVCCIFFSQLKLSAAAIKKLLLCLIVPLLSIGCATLFYTVSTPDIQFTTESNLATSGGFGPNQVSAVLGLGAFAATLGFLLLKNNFGFKLYFGIAILFLAAQSTLTFSRGGLYSAVGAALVVLLFQLQNGGAMVKRFVPFLLVVAVFGLLVFPFIDRFTDGKLGERFDDTGTTNRAEIMETDFEILSQNPILGVGVGEAQGWRKANSQYTGASHTEFTRLISEHGAFGLLALLSLLLMPIVNVKRSKTTFGKALAAGAAAWGFLYMTNVGMRSVAPAFMVGLSFVTVVGAYQQNWRRAKGKPQKFKPQAVDSIERTTAREVLR